MTNEVNRLKQAVAVLNEGGTMFVGDIRLGTFDGNQLTITGWTRYHSLENLTRSEAHSELREIKSLFAEMLNVSPELSEYARTKVLGYYLGFNCGQGAIGICNEVGGRLTWEVEIR